MGVGASSLLGGRYRLDERVARGGMGEVWRGYDTVLERPVAVKLPSPGFSDDPQFRGRFHQEARHAASVSHPNIANVFDYGEPGPREPQFLVMELVDGEPLSAVLHRVGPLPPEQVASLIAQVASALDAAHSAGLVHRDVKPGNLLLCPDGTVKVTDFGIARAATVPGATATGPLLGTAPYLSPEQVAGRSAVPASDLYSLGVVAYEALTGAPPFTGEPIAVAVAHRERAAPPLPASVPAPLAALVHQLLEKDPADRPPSARSVAQEARRLAGHTAPPPPVVAAPQSRPPRTRPRRRPANRHREAQLLAVAGVLVATVLALIGADLLGGGPAKGGRAAASGPAPHRTPSGRRSPSATGSPGANASTAPGSGATGTAVQMLQPVSVRLYEPNGGNDDPAGVGYADDGNPATAWQTEWYASAAFGNLKPGVGLVFDLGRPVAIRRLTISLLDAGTGVQVWAGPADPHSGQLVGSWTAAPGTVTLRPHAPVTARYWLVFLDHLPSTSHGYASGLSEVAFQGG